MFLPGVNKSCIGRLQARIPPGCRCPVAILRSGHRSQASFVRRRAQSAHGAFGLFRLDGPVAEIGVASGVCGCLRFDRLARAHLDRLGTLSGGPTGDWESSWRGRDPYRGRDRYGHRGRLASPPPTSGPSAGPQAPSGREPVLQYWGVILHSGGEVGYVGREPVRRRLAVDTDSRARWHNKKPHDSNLLSTDTGSVGVVRAELGRSIVTGTPGRTPTRPTTPTPANQKSPKYALHYTSVA